MNAAPQATLSPVDFTTCALVATGGRTTAGDLHAITRAVNVLRGYDDGVTMAQRLESARAVVRLIRQAAETVRELDEHERQTSELARQALAIADRAIG